MLAFVMLWAYLSYSQFLIIWSGNLKEEIPWYMKRAFGGWGSGGRGSDGAAFRAAVLAAVAARREAEAGAAVACGGNADRSQSAWTFTGSWCRLSTEGPASARVDILAVLGIGGVWIGTFFWQLKKMPLLPLHDPRFAGELEHQHGD